MVYKPESLSWNFLRGVSICEGSKIQLFHNLRKNSHLFVFFGDGMAMVLLQRLDVIFPMVSISFKMEEFGISFDQAEREIQNSWKLGDRFLSAITCRPYQAFFSLFSFFSPSGVVVASFCF
jgi:hypothetical protein